MQHEEKYRLVITILSPIFISENTTVQTQVITTFLEKQVSGILLVFTVTLAPCDLLYFQKKPPWMTAASFKCHLSRWDVCFTAKKECTECDSTDHLSHCRHWRRRDPCASARKRYLQRGNIFRDRLQLVPLNMNFMLLTHSAATPANKGWNPNWQCFPKIFRFPPFYLIQHLNSIQLKWWRRRSHTRKPFPHFHRGVLVSYKISYLLPLQVIMSSQQRLKFWLYSLKHNSVLAMTLV